MTLGLSGKPPEDSTDIAKEFHQLASAAVDLSNAHVSEAGILSIQRSIRDWENDKRKNLLYQFPIMQDPMILPPEEVLQQQPPMSMDPSIQIRLPSPSGKKILIVTKGMSGDKNKPELELWENGALVRKIPTIQQQQKKQERHHGSIIHDPTGFGTASWSPDESYITYVAERLPPTTHAFWEPYKNDNHKDNGGASSSIAGGQHVLGQGYMEEWGEQYVGQSPLLDLYILHLDSGKIGRITNVPGENTNTGDASTTTNGGVTLGQPVWHPTLPKIAYTGWDAGGLGKMPKRLGMVYCRNRASGIYTSDVTKLLQRLQGTITTDETDLVEDKDSDYESVTDAFPYARSPQFLKTGEMIFLANPKAFVSHDSCMGLYKKIGTNSVADCIVPVMDLPATNGPKVSDMGFPGLFVHQLPPNASCGSNHLVLSTVWGSLSRLIRVDLDTKQVQLLDFPLSKGDSRSASSHFLQCQTPSGDWIVSETATNCPASLWLLPHADTVQETKDETIVCENAKLLTKFPAIAASSVSSIQAFHDIPFDMEVISVPTTDDSLPPVQAILTLPKQQKESGKVGLIVIPHGGPHSATISGYVPGFALLASKYAIVFPNYHGSTGFGQAALESLLANIGDTDVKDVMRTTKHVIEEWKDRIDETKIGICGGSHGGFLTSHCIGQYPDFFKAAVMRNPVTNLASMATATDIPDWCHAEALGTYDFTKFRGPDKGELQTMYERSPIVHVSKVKTPTLMALGMKDLRVPPSQGMELFHALQSAGVDTKLLVYPEDNHALNRVATEADHWIHIRQWFNQYLG
ncbi:unnamed protein product [Cylindrotheca closterium]|uniref:acylaminoacyl-peptidase n=1 Tax=Cylindrotheca closterium TaxID=2856 RepID=A0AAD2FY59_9STRA|nr:unnamed protein product [Cylindrotheca closterium]